MTTRSENPLGAALLGKIAALFGGESVDAVAALLVADCGEGLPLIGSQGVNGVERVRCAVLKISGGSRERLDKAIRMANRDWRDVLMAAGFANDPFLHRAWLDQTEG